MLTYFPSNQQQPLHPLPQSGASGLQERLGAGPGVVGKSFPHQGLTAGFSWQQRLHGRQHALHQLADRYQREADVGEELPGVDTPFWTLTEPLQAGLKERLLAVLLNLVMKWELRRYKRRPVYTHKQGEPLTWLLER